MKKQNLILCVLIIMMCSMMTGAICGAATLATPTVTVNDDVVTLNFTMSDVNSGGTEVTLLVAAESALVGNGLDEANIVYIDQKTVLYNGTSTFDFVIAEAFHNVPLRAYLGVSGSTEKIFLDINPTLLTTSSGGDVNEDGEIDIGDVNAVYKHVRGKIVLSGSGLLAAYVNRDGVVDIGDVNRIYLLVRGKITGF